MLFLKHVKDSFWTVAAFAGWSRNYRCIFTSFSPCHEYSDHIFGGHSLTVMDACKAERKWESHYFIHLQWLEQLWFTGIGSLIM